MSKYEKIFIAAGGTGGHFFAAEAVAEELAHRGYEVHLVTDSRCQKYIYKDFPFSHHIVDLQQYPAGVLPKINFFIALLAAIYQSIKLFIQFKPKIVAGFGGYPVLPLMIAAVILRIPIVIHEQNCIIGRVNKLCSRFAKMVALSYEETEHNFSRNKVVITGGIVRSAIRSLSVKHNFDNEVLRIFVFGGSQGAKIFSELIPESIKILMHQNPELKLHVAQQVSKADQARLRQFYSKLNIEFKLSEFFDDIATQYNSTELVISRAGASTIAELEYLGLPALFIPLPSASGNHQFYNAKILENDKAGWCFQQSKLSAIKLAREILVIIKNRDLLKQVSSNLLKRRKEGYKILSDTIEKVIA